MQKRNPTILTRNQLYEMIWKEPVRTIAPRFGISDVALAKTCRKYHIPRPWRGYWREKETGHNPRQPKLLPWPKHLGNEPQAITFRGDVPPGESLPQRPPEPPSVQAQRAFEAEPAHLIHVPDMLTEPHRLVRRAAKLLKRVGERGILWPREWPCLDIEVTKDSLDRALRVFDAVLKAARARGWPVTTQSESPFQTRISVLEESIAISITERTQRIEHPPPRNAGLAFLVHHERYTYTPTGQLKIRLTDGESFTYGARVWNDGKHQRVETCLNDVMVRLVELAERRKAARREHELWRQRQEEEARQRRAAAERREREKERRQELHAEVEEWSRANQVRAYVTGLQEASREQVQQDPDGRLARWIRWAETYAENLDPLTSVAALPHDREGYAPRPLDLEGF